MFHVKRIGNLSARPEIIVDDRGVRLRDRDGNYVGMPGPFGRERVIAALRTNKTRGPVALAAPELLVGGGCYLGDPDGNLIGIPGVWVHRMLDARWVEDTRRLAG